MVKSLLATIQQVTGELALSQPSTVLSSTDSATQQLKALAVAACEELCDTHDWQRLVKSYTISTVPGVTAYDLPDDYLRLVANTGFNSTNSVGMEGSSTPSTWATRTTDNIYSDADFRIIGNQLVLGHVPGDTPQSISFEYISGNYVYDPGLLIQKSEFEQDSDQTIFNPRLLINFIKLKFMQSQGLPTFAEAESYNASLMKAKSSDTPSARIYMDINARRWVNFNHDIGYTV